MCSLRNQNQKYFWEKKYLFSTLPSVRKPEIIGLILLLLIEQKKNLSNS